MKLAVHQAKAVADSKNDLAGRPREAAPTFLSSQLIRQFGLRSIAIRNLRNLAAGVRKESANPRIGLFGRAVGMIDPTTYHDGLCDVVSPSLVVTDAPQSWPNRIAKLRLAPPRLAKLCASGGASAIRRFVSRHSDQLRLHRGCTVTSSDLP